VSPKVQRLVKLLSRLPGVGEKTAQRYVLWLLTADEALARSLGTDGKRDAKVLCVVARVHDLMAIERAGAMRGRYFVLGKLLSPLEGVGPEDLPLARLVERIRGDGVTEVIVATPPSVDGEATALLLKRELAPLGVAVTRIASGVPHGGDLEFADPITMGRALAGRQRL
jgi:recombination protein RecR